MDLNIWGQRLTLQDLDNDAIIFLESLPTEKPAVEWLWQEMDRVWYDKGLDKKKKLSNQNVGSFYSHPIWLVNGIFTAVDEESLKHREAIKKYLTSVNAKRVADYGGGSGVLADIITSNTDVEVDIIEPYPFEFFVSKNKLNEKIQYLKEFRDFSYDVVIAQDVLEHVDNPIATAHMISKHVKEDGYVIFANCFYPCIECHLPKTFFLRYTFTLIMRKMGLKYIGRVDNAAHALIFQRKGNLSLGRATVAASIARLMSPSIELVAILKRKFS